MEGVKEKIEQVNSLLDEIKSELNPLLNNAQKTEKKTQLEAVVKMTDQFDKINIDIPDEIRTLKFKLIQEMDQLDAAVELNRDLQNMLLSFVDQNKVRSKRQKKESSTIKSKPPKIQFGIKLIDLIEAKLIEPNTKIINTVDGEKYEATITQNGKVKLVHNHTTTLFNSLSSAAKAIMGRAINGWTWWYIVDNSGKKYLDYYRQILLRNGK
ncbi:MAG: hypothetical protein ACOH2D_16230 [Gelidibacter sp.]